LEYGLSRMRTWLNGQTSPEMLYLETKWASLIPFARATDLLKEVLPVGDLVNAEGVRNHLQLTAERIEQELSEERQLNRFEGSEQEWERQPLPDGPITVGIDGGYVRAAHKQGWFEVIAGKSVVAFRRDDEGEVPSAKCFGFVQTYDEKPRRRSWELMKSQGMQENQQVVRSACLSSSCGAVHENRDFASAGAIARRAAEKLASGAQPRSSQPARKGWQTQRRRSLAGRTKVARAASVKIPVNDEAETVRSAHPKTPSAASAAVPDHDERSASAPLSPVAHEDSDIGVSSQDRQPGKPRGPLAVGEGTRLFTPSLARRRARWVRATVRLASSGSEARGDDGFLARTLRPQVWDSGV
jgi:hypothetical protein